MQLWTGRRNASYDLPEVQIGGFVKEWIAWNTDRPNESADSNAARCTSREPRNKHVEVLSIPMEVSSGSLARLELVNDEYGTRRLKLSCPGKTAGNGRQ